VIECIIISDADSRYWRQLANKELEESLSCRWNVKKAKNVILFVGDGMSPDTITASRIYHGGETSRLAWEHFPHIGILKVSIGFLLDVTCILINIYIFYMRSSRSLSLYHSLFQMYLLLIIQTYTTNERVPDSASTATALFGGVKTNYEVIGVDANVQLGDCEASLNANYHVDSFITWAQAVGKATGRTR